MSGDPFQVQFHPKLGVVIYDPVAQMGLAREQMRLFKLGSMTSTTFMRSIVSKDLTACSETQVREKRSSSGHVSHRSQQPSQTVLRTVPPSLRLGGFHGVQGLHRDSLHLRHLQLRQEFASSQSRLTRLDSSVRA